MSPIRSLLLLSSIVALTPTLPTQAIAQTQLVSFPNRILAFDPGPPTTQTLRQYDVVWKAQLRWPNAAILDEGAELAAEEHRASLVAGDVLPEARLKFDDLSLSESKTYCVAPRPLPGSGGGGNVLGAMLYRKWTNKQFCLIDKDRDGVADMSVLVNVGSAAALQPVAIKPVRFHTEVGAEVGKGDYVQLKLMGSWLSLQIFQQEDMRLFDTFMTTTNFGRQFYTSRIKPKKLDDGRLTFEAPNGRYYIAYDKASKTGVLEWEGLKEFKYMPVPAEVGF